MHLRLVKHPIEDALWHYMRQHNLRIPDGLRKAALRTLAAHLMEIEVSALLAASRYERNPTRRAYRNGYRESVWSLANGDLTIRIPKLRRGSYYPSFLDLPEAEAAIQQFFWDAYVRGVESEQLRDLLTTLRIDADAAQVADLHAALYDVIEGNKSRTLNTDAVKLDLIAVRDRGRDRYLAIAADDDALLAHEITPEADEAFWQDFVRRLDGRSVNGVEYVVMSRVHTVVRVKETAGPSMSLAMVA